MPHRDEHFFESISGERRSGTYPARMPFTPTTHLQSLTSRCNRGTFLPRTREAAQCPIREDGSAIPPAFCPFSGRRGPPIVTMPHRIEPQVLTKQRAYIYVHHLTTTAPESELTFSFGIVCRRGGRQFRSLSSDNASTELAEVTAQSSAGENISAQDELRSLISCGCPRFSVNLTNLLGNPSSYPHTLPSKKLSAAEIQDSGVII